MIDAIGMCTCDRCKFFHRPDPKSDLGACIRRCPTPFIIGAVPAGGPLVDPSKPPQMHHVIRGYFPVVGPKDGCGEFEYPMGAAPLAKTD